MTAPYSDDFDKWIHRIYLYILFPMAMVVSLYIWGAVEHIYGTLVGPLALVLMDKVLGEHWSDSLMPLLVLFAAISALANGILRLPAKWSSGIFYGLITAAIALSWGQQYPWFFWVCLALAGLYAAGEKYAKIRTIRHFLIGFALIFPIPAWS